MSDPQQEYARALAAYKKARKRLSEAKTALAKAKAKPPPRIYTLAHVDALFPPSPVMMTLRATKHRVQP